MYRQKTAGVSLMATTPTVFDVAPDPKICQFNDVVLKFIGTAAWKQMQMLSYHNRVRN